MALRHDVLDRFRESKLAWAQWELPKWSEPDHLDCAFACALLESVHNTLGTGRTVPSPADFWGVWQTIL